MSDCNRKFRDLLPGCLAALALCVVASSGWSQNGANEVLPTSVVTTSGTGTAGSANPGTTGGSNAVASKANYVIGPGDVLSINVLNEPSVTGKVPVRPDGMISVPLIGDIQASGLAPEKLQATIAQKLAEYVREPSVTVVVEEMNSRQFNVMGQVQHPGSFTLSRPTRVLDALAQAGGFSEFAKVSKIYVLRRDGSGGSEKMPFNYKRVSQGRDDQDNIELQAGDTVIVP